MNFYLDTEFQEYQKVVIDGKGIEHKIDTIELISIGLIYEDQAFYLICHEFDIDRAWGQPWLKENVLLPIYKQQVNKISPGATFKDSEITKNAVRDVFLAEGYSIEEIKQKVLDFVNGRPRTMLTTKKTPKPVKQEDGTMEEMIEVSQSFDFSKPIFHAYFGDYDWVVFCWLFGRMVNLPQGFPMYCRDLKQMLDEAIEAKLFEEYKKHLPDGTIKFEIELRKIKAHRLYPINGNAHDALADAIWNKKLHEFIVDYKLGNIIFPEKDSVAEHTQDYNNAVDKGQQEGDGIQNWFN